MFGSLGSTELIIVLVVVLVNQLLVLEQVHQVKVIMVELIHLIVQVEAEVLLQ